MQSLHLIITGFLADGAEQFPFLLAKSPARRICPRGKRTERTLLWRCRRTKVPPRRAFPPGRAKF